MLRKQELAMSENVLLTVSVTVNGRAHFLIVSPVNDATQLAKVIEFPAPKQVDLESVHTEQ